MQDLFGDVPVSTTTDARSVLEQWVRRNREAFSPEEVIVYARDRGVAFDDDRAWGAVFSQAAKDGLIRQAGLFRRSTSNGSVRPGWVRA